MKKVLIVLTMTLAIVGSVYATEVKIEARTGVSYYQANLANTDLIAGVVSVGADMYCFEKNSIEFGFNAQFLYGWGTARYINTAKKYKEFTPGETMPSTNYFSYKSSYSVFFFGPVMRYSFTDKISARFGLQYLGEISGNNDIGFLLSADYRITNNLAVGIESRLGDSFDIGAVASYRF